MGTSPGGLNATGDSEDTYDRIHRKTWSRRTSAFLGAATLFGAVGMVGGAIASVLPAAMEGMGVSGAAGATLPDVGAVLGNMALFGGAAAWLGVTIGADVGANAGAGAAVIEEQDRRDREKGLAPTPSQQPQKPAAKPRMFNAKTALLMGAVFAAFGAIVAMSPITAPVVALMGLKAGTTAAGIVAGAVLGLFGATMGINFPVISNRLSNKYSEILKGDAFENKPEVAPQPAQPQLGTQPASPPAPAAEPTVQAEATASKHSNKLVRFCVTNIKSRSEAHDHNHDTTVITR
ncbi:MAG: hypothetical protein EBV03_05465 [Proteobacteria bacterium]|nr:hypothetical protein [Pseudomonadota bacterium]